MAHCQLPTLNPTTVLKIWIQPWRQQHHPSCPFLPTNPPKPLQPFLTDKSHEKTSVSFPKQWLAETVARSDVSFIYCNRIYLLIQWFITSGNSSTDLNEKNMDISCKCVINSLLKAANIAKRLNGWCESRNCRRVAWSKLKCASRFPLASAFRSWEANLHFLT